MNDTFSSLAALRLRLLQFYLPRLLTHDAPVGQEQWLQAWALQQLGEAVWTAPGEGVPHPLVLARLARLARLAKCIASEMRLPEHQREVGPDGPVWQRVQSYLRQTMPVVEVRLRAQLSSEEAEPAP
jgi:hypothetical protein